MASSIKSASPELLNHNLFRARKGFAGSRSGRRRAADEVAKALPRQHRSAARSR